MDNQMDIIDILCTTFAVKRFRNGNFKERNRFEWDKYKFTYPDALLSQDLYKRKVQ